MKISSQLKLIRKSCVARVKKPDIRNVIFDHCKTFKSTAESEATIVARIIMHRFENVRMHHSGTHHFEPFAAEFNRNLKTGFDEREVTGTISKFDVFSEDSFYECFDN